MKHKQIGKRLFCSLLTLILILSSVPAPILNAATTASGSCGTDVTWALADGVLTISGTGAMQDYRNASVSPWNSYKSEIESIIIEEGVTTVGNYAFTACENLKHVEIPDSVTTIGTSAFQNCSSLLDLYLGSGVQIIGSYAFYGCSSLTNVKIPDSVTVINMYAFCGCSNLQSVEFGKSVTKIIGSSFQQCGNLETVILNAENCTEVGSNAFSNCSNLTTIIIGPEVDHVSEQFWIAVNKNKVPNLTFRGSNYFSLAAIPSANAFGEILNELPKGDYFADASGVLYQIEEGKAALIYCPPGIETLTVPKELPLMGEDGPYSVTTVESRALVAAKNLTTVTFESPETITKLDALAMADCPTLQSVNGKTSATEAKALFSNAAIGANVLQDTALTENSDGTLRNEPITVISENGPVLTLETDSGAYYTGETCKTIVNISNPDNAVPGHVLRVYFQFSDDDGVMNYGVGEHQIKVGDNIYTIQVCETESDVIYYMEIPQPVPGDTISLDVTTSYPSPSSGGGDVIIWGAILTKEEVDAIGTGITIPQEYHQSTWQTRADDFPVIKESADSVTLEAEGTANGNIYVKNLKYTIAIQRSGGDTLEGVGKDYMRSITYEDILTLPEGISWREGVLEAIRNGQSSVNGNNCYVTVNGEKIQLLTLSASSSVTRNVWLSLTEDGNNIILNWEYTNTSTTKEMPLVTTTLTYGPNVLCVTDPDVVGGKTYGPFINDVKVVEHFTYSDDVVKTSQATSSVTVAEANFKIDKSVPSYSGYFGGGYNFRIEITNTGNLPYDYLTRVTDPLPSIFYLAPSDMQAMFVTDAADENTTLSIQITNATLCEVAPEGTVTGTDGEKHALVNATSGVGTEYSGLESKDSVPTESATLLLTLAEDDSLLLTVTRQDGTTEAYSIGEGKEYATIADAFTAIRYLVTRWTQFNLTWTYAEDFRLWGNQKLTYNIPAKAKDSFMLATKDVESYVASRFYDTNYAHAYYTREDGTEAWASDSYSASINCDFTLYKGASVNGTVADKSTNLKAGDVITYSLSLNHPGGASYDALPMVDHLQGGQVLIVPAAENSHLCEAPYFLQETSIGEGTYYVLDKAVEYKNVTVGGMLTDSVVVTETEHGGLSTLIRWYLTDVKSSGYNKVVSYEALVNSDYAEEDGVVYALNNEVWVGDHQSHRIWDTIGLYASHLSFDKSIVTSKGESPAADTLEEYTTLKEGMVTTYRFTLNGVGDSIITVTGNDIYDILPASVNQFWNKDAITVRYVAEDGTELMVTNGDHWYVAGQSPTGETLIDRQYLCWEEDFSMTINGTVYIYVTLKCPEGDVWQSYAAQYGDTRLQNDLIIFDGMDSVYHDLAVPAEAILQKGVYGTAIKAGGSTTYGNYAMNTFEDSRLYYANDDAYDRLVFYYVTLYNGGDGRLYLNDLQDVLPKGFTFYGMYYDNQSSSSPPSTYMTPFGADSFVTASDTENSSISWRYALVSPTVQTLDSGRQKVTFSIKDYASTTNDLLYDELTEKYYLAPGQGVKFVYICYTNDAQDTEDFATNQVVMPYYDYTGAGVTVSENVTISAQGSSPKRNDGDCEVLDNGGAESLGFTGGQSDTQWLSSDVTVLRGNIVPGITKAVENNKTNAHVQDTITWQVTVTNEGEYHMTDYTITDVMQAPYQFVGDVKYNIYYDTNRSDIFRTEATLFSISERTLDAPLTIISTSGTQYTLRLGETVTVPFKTKAYYSSYDGAYRETSSNVEVSVKLDESGNEVLALRFPDGGMSIPECGYSVLSISTRNTTLYENKMYYNTAYITPNTQSYDANRVSQGNNTTINEAASVRNSCPITVSMGYFTSSEKTVTQTDDLSNTASSNDATNYIILPDKETLFDFTLQVENTKEKAMEKLILIDNLPEVNDHSTFVKDDPRYSEFKVSLATNPNFIVTVTDIEGAETVLTKGEYRLEFSDKTQFATEDWRGEGTDWYETQSDTTRSFRVIIEDTAGTLIPAGATICVKFTAEIDGEAGPGQIAWNSFGYHYNLVGLQAELEAAPLKVGVKVPSVPQIKKQLTLENGAPFVAEKDETFRFLIYEGAAIALPDGTDGYTDAQLADCLTQAGRKFTYVELKVVTGQSVSEAVLLKNALCYTFEDGQWKATGTAWDWVHKSKYTVIELSVDSPEFVYAAMNGNTRIEYTFTYDYDKKEMITCVNHRKSWKFTLHKTDVDTGVSLDGAIFGLYSPDATDAISKDAYAALAEELGFKPKETITVGESTYYLKQVKTTDVSGQIVWTDLLRTEYYLYELRAPKGYFVNGEPVLVESPDYENIPAITVTNKVGAYELPSSAGMGIHWYMIGGTLLMVLGLVLFGVTRRKRSA